ncbi:MAG: Xaa-Pro peptidase family protein [Oscillospiraceae bacterium]|nr:Xaa-Pro peptidase family protein [Oscillospiraceae bacterium]MCD7767936.1 Xaa-Pro peptidase family protein [Oscillospiraceae bacterium]
MMRTNRIEALQAALTAQGLDALLLLSPVNIRYAVRFFIMNGALVITPHRAALVTDSRYIEAAQEEVTDAEVLLATSEHPLASVVLELLTGCKTVGAEERSLPHADWTAWEGRLGQPLRPAETLLLDARAVKDAEELENITAAQRIAETALDEVLGLLHPGMTEREVAAELTYRMLRHGGEGNSFDPITVTGHKTSIPHAVPGDDVIERGDFVLMDFGCLRNGYCSDMTRTVAVGTPTDEMRRVYDIVFEAQAAGIAAARAGVTGAEIHNAAAKVIADAGYGHAFGHAFGHSLGLEIHETPGATPKNLEPMPVGAVISAEPGIYLPGKFGVRIEDMLCLTPDGNRNLTNAPKELIIL